MTMSRRRLSIADLQKVLWRGVPNHGVVRETEYSLFLVGVNKLLKTCNYV